MFQSCFWFVAFLCVKNVPGKDRACLKNHSYNLHAPLCGIFCPNSVAVAHYGALVRTKSPTNCDAHLAESLFQTRSREDWEWNYFDGKFFVPFYDIDKIEQMF